MLKQLLLILMLSPGVLWAQEELYAQLAAEVCSCMQEIKYERPRGFARACLHRVTRENSVMVEQLLGRPLGGDYQKDITELTGHMTAYLAADCPFLQTLTAAPEVTEFRWSDSKALNPSSARLSFPKGVAPFTPSGSITEAPLLWTIKGTVVAITPNLLTVATAEGQETQVEIPKRLRSQLVCQIGDNARFTYRLEWRIREGRVAKILVE